MSAIYTTDPATNERVTLSELARRHGIHVSTLSRRHAEGLRGQALINKIDFAAHLAAQNAKKTQEVERREWIMAASMAALSRPLRHIADAWKMVGGAQ
ncbi:hypothetical protein [Vreelandella boliviensis]|uniref:hypothetical protein n=1 Tax=Vreelandella boliviensis TaxID=223527 RepID=UPI001B8D4D25|nr:hypothetical protein [Halomonas boliviensis]MBS3670162.1 hypothetical protein [Halomonas boliviensis]